MKYSKVEFRCSEEEKLKICENSNKVGLDISKFCRKCCVEGIKVMKNRNDTKSLELEINNLSYEINKLGVNVNQIAYVLNAFQSFDLKSISDGLKNFTYEFIKIEKKMDEIQKNIEQVYNEWQ